MIKTNQMIGDANKNIILELIRKEGPISRADISRRLNICKPSVSANVKALLDAGVVRESGSGTNLAGKKSILLSFNANKAYVIGVDIGNFKIRAALSNLSGDLLEISEVEHETNISGEQILKLTNEAITSLLQKRRIGKEDCLAMGIGVPGIREARTGKNLLAPFITDWEDLDIESYLADSFGMTVLLENNVKAGAIGECWKGAAVEYDNMVYINFGKGIGAGIVLNKELFKGRNNAAGEIGYLFAGGGNIQGGFEKAGAFERSISTEFLIPRYNQLQSGPELSVNSIDSMTYIFDKYEKGETAAVEILTEMLDSILAVLVNLSATLNPDAIIFGGGLGERLGDYFDYFVTGLKNNVPFVPDLKLAKLGVNSGVYGAVALALRVANSDYKNLF